MDGRTTTFQGSLRCATDDMTISNGNRLEQHLYRWSRTVQSCLWSIYTTKTAAIPAIKKKGQQLSDEDIRENKSLESEAKMHRTKRAKALNNYQFVSIFCMKQHFMGNFFFFSSPFLGFLSLSLSILFILRVLFSAFSSFKLCCCLPSSFCHSLAPPIICALKHSWDNNSLLERNARLRLPECKANWIQNSNDFYLFLRFFLVEFHYIICITFIQPCMRKGD